MSKKKTTKNVEIIRDIYLTKRAKLMRKPFRIKAGVEKEVNNLITF